jgi:hypothetical protein
VLVCTVVLAFIFVASLPVGALASKAAQTTSVRFDPSSGLYYAAPAGTDASPATGRFVPGSSYPPPLHLYTCLTSCNRTHASARPERDGLGCAVCGGLARLHARPADVCRRLRGCERHTLMNSI